MMVPLLAVKVPEDLVQLPLIVRSTVASFKTKAPPSINRFPDAVLSALRVTVPEEIVIFWGISVDDQEKSPELTS
jgi:hypothetical protein